MIPLCHPLLGQKERQIAKERNLANLKKKILDIMVDHKMLTLVIYSTYAWRDKGH